MHRRTTSLSAALLAAVFAASFARPAAAQQMVVSIKSADALMADVKLVLSVLGQEAQAGGLEMLKGALKGLDGTKPITLYADLPENPGGQPNWALAIPVTSSDEVLATLKQFQFKATKGDGDVHTLVNPQGQTSYLRFFAGYGFVSQTAASVRGELPDPIKIVPAGAGTSLISASVRLDKIPAPYKQIIRQAMDQEVEKNKVRREGESEAEHQGRQFGAKAARDLFSEVLDDGAEVVARLDIDHKQTKQAAYEVTLTPKPGSKLAARITAFEDSRSVFAGLAADAAFSAFLCFPLNDDLRQVAAAAFKEGIQKELDKQDDANVRTLMEKLVKGISDTVATDVIDGAVVGRGPLADGKYVILAAVKVKDGKQLDKAIRDVLAQLPDEVKAAVTLDAAKQGGAVIHKIHPDKELDEGGKRILGTNDIFIAIREDVILVAVGQNGEAVIKESLELAGKAAPLIAPSVQAEASVARLLPLIGVARPDKVSAVSAKYFSGDDKAKDRIRWTLRGGRSLQFRFEMNWQCIPAIMELQKP